MIDYAVETNWVDPDNLLFSKHPCREKKCTDRIGDVQEWDELSKIAMLYRSQPDFIAPDSFVGHIKKLVESGQYQLL